MKSISTFLCLLASITPGLSQVSLGTAATYGVLAVAGITNSGATTISGNMGTTGKSIIGFPPGIVNGTTGTNTAAVTQARADAVSAYTTAQGLASTETLPQIIGGQTLVPGVYHFTRTATLTGILTLSGAGTYVFQIANTFATSAASEVVLTNGAEASDVIWAVGATAGLGAGSTFVGHVIAEAGITVGAGTSVVGGLYAGAAITLDDNNITAA